MAKLISKTYGEALCEVAMEGQKTDLFLQEAQDILTILDENPELDKLMKHPKVSRQEKEQVLDNVFLGNVSREMTGFMKLLINFVSIIIKANLFFSFECFINYFNIIKQGLVFGFVPVTNCMDILNMRTEIFIGKSAKLFNQVL